MFRFNNMQSGTIYTTDLENFSPKTITLSNIPLEVGYVLNDSQGIHSHESVPVVELGKQLLQHAKNGDTEIVRDLMCRGAPFQTDQMGTNALHFAAQNNHLETADVLLRAGISRDARTKVDRTPLHMAGYEGHEQMAILLLRYGADVDCRDMLKMTPLHWAIECEHEEVMHVLLDHGADPNALSKFDKTPITLAFEHHRLDLVDIMQQERQIITPKPILYNQQSKFETQNFTQMKTHGQFEQQPFAVHQHFDNKIIQVPIVKKPKMVCQNIHITSMSDDDQEKSAELIEKISNISHRTFKKSKTALETTESPFELLEAIMIPPENDSNIVENAVASGGKLVMTEAGKRAYNLTGVNQLRIKRLQLGGTRKNVEKKIITFAKTDQFSNHTMLRGPNILKKANIGNKTGNFDAATFGNDSTEVTVAEKAPKKSLKVLHSQEVRPVGLQLIEGDDGTDNIDLNDASMKQVTDIVILYQQLAEARKMAADYQKRYKYKEAEAEIYKRQLKKITSQKTEK